MQQLIKSDRGSMFMASDDNVMLKQIQTTHNPDGREIDVKPILNLVEDILSRATLSVDSIIPVRVTLQYNPPLSWKTSFSYSSFIFLIEMLIADSLMEILIVAGRRPRIEFGGQSSSANQCHCHA